MIRDQLDKYSNQIFHALWSNTHKLLYHFLKALWDKTLEFRFLLQKAFANSNRLPQVSLGFSNSFIAQWLAWSILFKHERDWLQEPVRSSFCDSDEVVGMAYADVITSSKKTLESLLELQEVWLSSVFYVVLFLQLLISSISISLFNLGCFYFIWSGFAREESINFSIF